MSAALADVIVRSRSIPVERTPQRLDPLGVQAAWLFVPLGGLVAVGYAVASTMWHRDQIQDPATAIVALGVLVLAAVAAAARTHPRLAPFGAGSHIVVVGLVLVASCLFTATVWEHNARIQDDWGQIAVALFLMMMPLYRPVAEVLAVASVSALVFGVFAALQYSTLTVVTEPLVYALVAAVPILALASGGAGYAWTMTGETLRWRESARASRVRLDEELRQAAARMVAQERATLLNAEAVPFLSSVLVEGRIDTETSERAAQIAKRLRTTVVQALERSLLAETVVLALAERGIDVSMPCSLVDDPHGLDRVLTEEQRAVVGALISTVVALPGLEVRTLRVAASNPDRPEFLLTARVQHPRVTVRRALWPLVSTLRSLSMEAGMRMTGDLLAVRFAYAETRKR